MTTTTTFATGSIVRFSKSGKLYFVTGHISAQGPDCIGVTGWKNDAQFGPIRFLDTKNLEFVAMAEGWPEKGGA